MNDNRITSYWGNETGIEDRKNFKGLTFKKREFKKFSNALNEEEKVIADKALNEINRLENELQLLRHQKSLLETKNRNLQEEVKKEEARLKETLNFFSKWAEGFVKLLKTPVDLENDSQIRHHYFVLRDSIKNLAVSCRKKTKEVNLISENKK